MDAPLSPMSKQALDNFLASRARNFNHMNKIHTRPPSVDHEYFSSTSNSFAFTARKISQTVVKTIQSGVSSKDVGTEASETNSKLIRVHSLKDLNYKYKMQSRQLHVYKRGKCMEIIIANEAENNACTPEVSSYLVNVYYLSLVMEFSTAVPFGIRNPFTEQSFPSLIKYVTTYSCNRGLGGIRLNSMLVCAPNLSPRVGSALKLVMQYPSDCTCCVQCHVFRRGEDYSKMKGDGDEEELSYCG